MLILQKPGSFGYLNLNSCAKEFRQKHWVGRPNPLNDPQLCAQMIDDYHRAAGLTWSYGGWLEDRRDLWEGSYLEEKKTFHHLGVDFNVPSGSLVEIDYPARVLQIMTERPPIAGGWGTRVIMELLDHAIMLVYAHLDSAVHCFEGKVLTPGTRFASVGHWPENGGWYPHLHLQAIDLTVTEYGRFDPDDENFDGYGAARDYKKLARLYPDPLQYWKFK